MYLYRVDYGNHGVRVEVGIYDPQRWAKSVERGETPQAAGMSFGETAEMLTSSVWSRDESYTAEVTMGAIGSHDIETAMRRIDVYTQATDIARFVNAALEAGDSITDIGKWLKANLAQDPANPADGPFKYKGDIGLYPSLAS